MLTAPQKVTKIIAGFGIILVLALFTYTSAVFAGETQYVYVFRSFRQTKPEKMILVGEIQAKTKELTFHNKKILSEYDMRPDRITVKIFNSKGLRQGQKIYIIDKNPYHDLFRDGNIVGEAEIASIYYSSFYGSWALSARGFLLRIRKGQFVARSQETESLESAYESKLRGDHYAALGEYEKASASYREALSNDISLAEAHAGLAQIFFQNAKEQSRIGSTTIEALNSYEQAWRYRKNFHYQHEKLMFCHNYIEALEYNHEIDRQEAGHKAQELKYLDRIIEAAKEANRMEAPITGKKGEAAGISLKTGAALAQAHYYRMLHHASQSSPREREEYDHSQDEADTYLKKILKMEQKNAKSLKIAILFYYHRYEELRNKDKNNLQMRAKIRDLLLEKLGPYYGLYLNPKKERRDPKVDSILNKLRKTKS